MKEDLLMYPPDWSRLENRQIGYDVLQGIHIVSGGSLLYFVMRLSDGTIRRV